MEHKNFCLEVLKGKSKGQTFSLSANNITIGRKLAPKEKKKDWLLFEDQSLARIHAILLWDEEKSLFRVVQKSEGKTIKVNGNLVKEAYLYHLDKIQLGDVVLRIWDGPVDKSLLEPEELEESLTEDKEEARATSPAPERSDVPSASKPVQELPVIADTALIKPDKNETRPLKYSKLITPSEKNNIKSFSFFTNKTDKQEKEEVAQVNFKPVDLFKSSVVKNLSESSDFQPISIVRPYDGNSVVGMKKTPFSEMSFNDKIAGFDPQYISDKPEQTAQKFFAKEEQVEKSNALSFEAPEDSKPPLSTSTPLPPSHSSPGVFTDKTLFKTGSDASDSDDFASDISDKISQVQSQKSNKYSFGQYGRKKPLPPIKGLSPSEGFVADESSPENEPSLQETALPEEQSDKNQILPSQNVPKPAFDSAFEETLSRTEASLPTGDINAFEEEAIDEEPPIPGFENLTHNNFLNSGRRGLAYISGDVLSALVSGEAVPTSQSSSYEDSAEKFSPEASCEAEEPRAWEGSLLSSNVKDRSNLSFDKKFLHPRGVEQAKPNIPGSLFFSKNTSQGPGPDFSEEDITFSQNTELHLQVDISDTTFNMPEIKSFDPSTFELGEKIMDSDPSFQKFVEPNLDFSQYTSSDIFKNTLEESEVEAKSEMIPESPSEPSISETEQLYLQSFSQEQDIPDPPSFSSTGMPPYLPDETPPYASVLYPKKKQLPPFKIKAKKISRLHLPSDVDSEKADTIKESFAKNEPVGGNVFENKNSMPKEPMVPDKRFPHGAPVIKESFEKPEKVLSDPQKKEKTAEIKPAAYQSQTAPATSFSQLNLSNILKEENILSNDSLDNIDIKFSPEFRPAQAVAEDSQTKSTPAFFGFSQEDLLELSGQKDPEDKASVAKSWDAISGNTLSYSPQTAPAAPAAPVAPAAPAAPAAPVAPAAQTTPPLHSPIQDTKSESAEVSSPVLQEAEKKEKRHAGTAEAQEAPSYFDAMIKKYNLPPILQTNEPEELSSTNIFPVNESFEVKSQPPSLPLGKPFASKPIVNFENLSVDGIKLPTPKWSLKFIKSPEGEKLFNIEHDEIFIGRIKGIDVTFDDLQLADRHIKLYTYEDKLYLQKLEKNRPILINGNPLVTAAGRVLLQGDTVQLSDRIVFVVQKDI